MFKKILLLCIVATLSFASFKEVDYVQMQDMIKKGVKVIDIRRIDEFKRFGIIKSAHTLTFFDNQGHYDIPSWMNKFVKIVKNKDEPFILYCAHANRSKVVGNFLDKQVGYKNVYDLKGGIEYGWIDKGLKTVKYK